MTQPSPDPILPDQQHLDPWPYSRSVYLARFLWLIVHRTIWKLCWSRINWLRPFILRIFGAKVDPKVGIKGSVWVEMPWDMSMGEFGTLGPRVTLYNLGGVSIGHHTVLSQDVYVCGGTHDYTDPRCPLIRTKIVIGNYVWIAAGAFIGPGVTIGDGAVIGARAVVISDVPPWTVVAGNPAKVVKERVMKSAS
jgi:putative colanic acid biosynthesis acetyltransferase WcaF